jgi:hypothetical protein
MNEAPLGDTADDSAASTARATPPPTGNAAAPDSGPDSPANGRDVDVEKTAIDEDPSKEVFVAWEGEDDPECPYNLPKWRKWLIVANVSTASLCVCVRPIPGNCLSWIDELNSFLTGYICTELAAVAW